MPEPAHPLAGREGPIAFVDGTCGFCSAGARLIARLDRSGDIRIATVQSALGRAVLPRHGLDPDDPMSWLYLADGRALTGADGVIALGRRLGGWPRAGAALLAALPRPLRDALYRVLARHRYALMGRADLCALPDPDLRRRLIG